MGSTCTPTHSLSIKVRPPPASTLFPYTTLFRSQVRGVLGRRGGVDDGRGGLRGEGHVVVAHAHRDGPHAVLDARGVDVADGDRKSTRLNSSHVAISYAVFCLKKKKCAEWQHGHQ